MPGSLVQLTRCSPVLPMVRDEPTVDQFSLILPWLRLVGDRVNQPTSTPQNWGSAFWGAAGTATQDSLTSPDDNPTEFLLARGLAELKLDSYCNEIYSGDNSILQTQLDPKIRALQDLLGAALIYGRGVAFDEFNGLVLQAVGPQKINADHNNVDGGPLGLEDLDLLINLITAQDGRRICLVMNTTVLQIWKNLHYQVGTIPEVAFCPYLGIETYVHGTAFIVVSNFILNNEAEGAGTDQSSVYALIPDVTTGVYGVFKSGRCGGFVEISEVLLENDASLFRLSLNAGLATHPAGVARLAGIDTV